MRRHPLASASALASRSRAIALVVAGEPPAATHGGAAGVSGNGLDHRRLDGRGAEVVRGRPRRRSRRRTRTSTSSTRAPATTSRQSLSTAVQGGNPPDLAAVPQPGLMKDFASRGALKPIDFAKGTIAGELRARSGSSSARSTGSSTASSSRAPTSRPSGTTSPSFKNAGVKPPKTWPQFLAAAKTIRGVGHAGVLDRRRRRLDAHRPVREHLPPPGRARTKYDQLPDAQDQVDRPVREGRRSRTMAQVLGDTGNIAGGTSGALQTDFPTSVSNVFATTPKAAMVIEGDFVPGVVAVEEPAKPVTGYNVFAFPSIDGSPPAVVGGGDIVIMFKDTPASRALIKYLATPEAARSGRSAAASRRRTRTCRRARTRTRSPARRRSRSRRRRRSASTCPTCSRRRSAARSGRASGRSSRTS